ncbi:MAG: ACT domain-containing protein [Armatimonadota bacterium]|nr:ACT domain-containing protein [Armatimonadota bacterium]MDR7452277.1 ACT domain-containing protein [Armatimonadota bacterium]MDR7467959.1 ACT domain-containing protein [Armatimonadota bacterium]MDR7494801.1 ACT domain-containing protein [Armatimonadota bacterium]MDR7499244.1 ACT domain-containing protein [Armatimonadota bacterium]
MAKDLSITLEDRPGALAALGEALGKAGVNIEGICGVSVGGKGHMHLLVEDAVAARRALQQAGIPVTGEEDVLVLDLEDRPGALGAAARKIANAGVNITLVYLATRTRVVIGASDLVRARAAVGA